MCTMCAERCKELLRCQGGLKYSSHLVFQDRHQAERLLGDEVDDRLIVLEGDRGYIQALQLVLLLRMYGI